MPHAQISQFPVEEYFIRRLAEEQARAAAAATPRERAGHERAAQIFRELIDAAGLGLPG